MLNIQFSKESEFFRENQCSNCVFKNVTTTNYYFCLLANEMLILQTHCWCFQYCMYVYIVSIYGADLLRLNVTYSVNKSLSENKIFLHKAIYPSTEVNQVWT